MTKPPFNGAKLLVCGGAGFIGSNFIRRILAQSPKATIICLDALTYAGNKDNLKGLPKDRFFFVKGDITDKSLITRVFKKYQPSHVINFAAESHVDRSIHVGAESFIHTNVYGTLVLLEAVRDAAHKITKFVHVSTDEVYGSLSLKDKKIFTELSPLAPNSPYAASKASADLLVRSFFKTYDLPLVITRCSNNYGPYQHPEKLIPFSIMRLVAGKPIAIYGDGKYVRDWIHVEDHCSALLLALTDGVPGEIYNIGADEEVNNLDLAHRLLLYFKKEAETAIIYVKDRPGHDRRYAIDSSKIRKELGWKPKHSFKTSLKVTIDWYVQNTVWTKRSLARSGAANTHI
jgi:dTDP-glucose 4,6-dehydratase